MALLFRAHSVGDFRRKLALVDIEVFPLSAGRTKEQAERFSVAHFLSSLPLGHLGFPIAVEHGDRPDCVVTIDKRSIGIEITEAVPENVARASVLRQSGVDPDVHFIPHARPGESPRSTAALRREIELDAPGSPWVGNQPEREWAEAMLHFAAIKVQKAQKPGFTKHPLNWLLIYDNWPLPGVRHPAASSILAGKCAEASIFATFDRVFVLDSKLLCEVGETVQLHEVREPSAGS